ncbi:MAG TPA: enoyl-CoA hydratase/isomerase family protein [Acidimicrobiales bacterium]|nr:enoyl-CoA hydratase/isomerase family protein [Acidimicrobiales bacterium]
MTASGPILLEIQTLDERSRVALVRLNRPDQLNPIDAGTLAALDGALDQVLADPWVRAILVTGAGRAFSAGGDLKSYRELQRDPVMFPRFVEDLHRIFGRLRAAPIPAIALVNGVTAAGGLELLLNCDFALAARSARIGDGHLNFGQMGGGGVLTLLPRAIGRARAAELIFSGRLLDAAEAAEWGLVSRVVDDDRLEAEGLALARGIAEKSRLALANAKYVLHSVWADNASIESGLRLERERDAFYCLTSTDAPEGLAAFAEKRPPKFEGR